MLYRLINLFFILAILISLSAFIQLNKTGPVNYQLTPSETGWSKPLTIFEDPNGHVEHDYMFSDSSGVAHLFWSYNKNNPSLEQFDTGETFIYYTKMVNGFFDVPIDILNYHNATLPFSLTWEETGNFYLATKAGSGACLNFIAQKVSNLSSVKIMSNTRCIQQGGIGAPNITMNNDGILFIVFVQPDQRTLAIIKSTDKGKNWDRPHSIYIIPTTDSYLNEPVMKVDENGLFHVIWTEVTAPSGYPPKRIMYFRSKDGGVNWSTPYELATQDQAEQNIAIYKENIYVIWNGDVGLKNRYFRMSTNEGINWFDRVTLPMDHVNGGLQGKPAIVVDNTGVVHVLYADNAYLYYNTLRNGIWGNPETIASPGISKSRIEIKYTYLTITEGNKLHAFYTRDYIAVDYQHKLIQARHEDPVPLLSPTPLMEVSETKDIEINATPTYLIDLEKIKNSPIKNVRFNNSSTVLLISSVLVGSLVLLVIIMQKNRRF